MHQENEEDYLEDKESNDEGGKKDYGHGEHLITKKFLIEVFILILVPIPYYDTYIITNATGMDTVYFLSEFMLVFMFARMYFLVKSCLNYNQFMNPYAKKLCKAYGFE